MIASVSYLQEEYCYFNQDISYFLRLLMVLFLLLKQQYEAQLEMAIPNLKSNSSHSYLNDLYQTSMYFSIIIIIIILLLSIFYVCSNHRYCATHFFPFV